MTLLFHSFLRISLVFDPFITHLLFLSLLISMVYNPLPIVIISFTLSYLFLSLQPTSNWNHFIHSFLPLSFTTSPSLSLVAFPPFPIISGISHYTHSSFPHIYSLTVFPIFLPFGIISPVRLASHDCHVHTAILHSHTLFPATFVSNYFGSYLFPPLTFSLLPFQCFPISFRHSPIFYS